jgi:hypothetical protein
MKMLENPEPPPPPLHPACQRAVLAGQCLCIGHLICILPFGLLAGKDAISGEFVCIALMFAGIASIGRVVIDRLRYADLSGTIVALGITIALAAVWGVVGLAWAFEPGAIGTPHGLCMFVTAVAMFASALSVIIFTAAAVPHLNSGPQHPRGFVPIMSIALPEDLERPAEPPDAASDPGSEATISADRQANTVPTDRAHDPASPMDQGVAQPQRCDRTKSG